MVRLLFFLRILGNFDVIVLKMPFGGQKVYNYLFYRQRRSFFTATGRFLNRGGCCRHAKHGVGDDGDDKEENLFSNCRHRLPPKGEADNIRHGFLC